jgi:hypothetical protein
MPINLHPNTANKVNMESLWLGANLSIARLDKLLGANDIAMIEVRMGGMDAIIRASAIQEQVFDNICFAFKSGDVIEISNRFNTLSNLISIAQRIRNGGGNQIPNLNKMIDILVTTNRVLHIHLARLKLTWSFDERMGADKRINLALDIKEPDESEPKEEVKEDG